MEEVGHDGIILGREIKETIAVIKVTQVTVVLLSKLLMQ
jgi:hypothetical protein